MSLSSLPSAVHVVLIFFSLLFSEHPLSFQPLFSIPVPCPAYLTSSPSASSKTFISSPSVLPLFICYYYNTFNTTRRHRIRWTATKLCKSTHVSNLSTNIQFRNKRRVGNKSIYHIYGGWTFVDTANKSSCVYVPFSAL